MIWTISFYILQRYIYYLFLYCICACGWMCHKGLAPPPLTRATPRSPLNSISSTPSPPAVLVPNLLCAVPSFESQLGFGLIAFLCKLWAFSLFWQHLPDGQRSLDKTPRDFLPAQSRPISFNFGPFLNLWRLKICAVLRVAGYKSKLMKGGSRTQKSSWFNFR